MTSALLEALKDVDEEMVGFLLETLEHNVEDPDLLLPLLESYLGDKASEALSVLTTDKKAISKARDALKEAELHTAAQPLCFPFARKVPTFISAAEDRGISLRQLQGIFDFIQDAADPDGFLPWTDEFEQSPTFGQRLHLHQINLYHAVKWVVKPATQKHECSMVELLAEKPQIPRWFVSHAWAEPLRDFLIAVTKHAQIREISEDDVWWVCAYANNQHKIDTEISSNDPRKTSFYRAMQKCEGVILCLDESATPLRRIWCCFEEAMLVSKDEKRLLLDLATVVKGQGVVLTDGFVESDFSQGGQYALEVKRDRETAFPLELLEQGYQIDIRTADAINQNDKRRILNTIAGDVPTNDLGRLDPNLKHPSFQRVNHTLRGIFAEMATRKAAEAGRLKQVVEVLGLDKERTKLTLNLGGCKREDLPPILDLSGHPALKELTIDLNSSTIKTLHGIGHLIMLPQLVKLHLSFAWSSTLSSATELVKGFMSLQALKALSLNFSGCAFDVVLPGMENLKLLETLCIDFSYTQTTEAPSGLSTVKTLRELTLLFGGCRSLTDDESLVPIQSLERLESLTLDFSRSGLADFIPETKNMGSLEKLHLDYSATNTVFSSLERCDSSILTDLTVCFTQCNQLVDINNTFWRRCRSLRNVTCDFSNNSRLRQGRGLASLEELPMLSRLSLFFSFCIRLEEVLPWLRRAVTHRPQLDVDFTGCAKLDPSLQAHFQSLTELEALELWPSTADVKPSTAGKELLLGDKVEYFSPYNQQWLPAVVSLVGPDHIKVEFEADGKSWTSRPIPRPIRGSKSLRWPWAGRRPKLSSESIAKAKMRAEEEKLENVGKWTSSELKDILAFRGLPVHKAFKNNQQTIRSWIRGRQAKSNSARESAKQPTI